MYFLKYKFALLFLEFSPAEIMWTDTEVLLGDTLELRCVILQKMETDKVELTMYLYKDGNIAMKETVTSSGKVVFSLPQVTREDSGNYSCIYTTAKSKIDSKSIVGHNSVFIQVTGRLM